RDVGYVSVRSFGKFGRFECTLDERPTSGENGNSESTYVEGISSSGISSPFNLYKLFGLYQPTLQPMSSQNNTYCAISIRICSIVCDCCRIVFSSEVLTANNEVFDISRSII